jgi:hypothetical protein
MKKTKFAIFASLTLCVASTQAATLVYEGFGETVGTNTASAANASSTATTTGLAVSGTTGLTGSYTMNRGGSGNNVSGTAINGTTMTFGTLPTSGGKLQWTGFGSTASGNQMTVNLDSAAASALAPGATNKTIWMSALINPGTFANGGGVFLGNNAVSGDTPGATVFGLGFNSAGNAVVYYNNGVTAATSGTYTASSTYWLVGNFTFNLLTGTTTFSSANMWIYAASSGNPPASEVALGAAMASFSGSSTTAGGRVPSNLLFKTGSSLANSQFDEVRVGDTYLSAIPEPTTWALLAGSLTTLMVFRRRRA